MRAHVEQKGPCLRPGSWSLCAGGVGHHVSNVRVRRRDLRSCVARDGFLGHVGHVVWGHCTFLGRCGH